MVLRLTYVLTILKLDTACQGCLNLLITERSSIFLLNYLFIYSDVDISIQGCFEDGGLELIIHDGNDKIWVVLDLFRLREQFVKQR